PSTCCKSIPLACRKIGFFLIIGTVPRKCKPPVFLYFPCGLWQNDPKEVMRRETPVSSASGPSAAEPVPCRLRVPAAPAGGVPVLSGRPPGAAGSIGRPVPGGGPPPRRPPRGAGRRRPVLRLRHRHGPDPGGSLGPGPFLHPLGGVLLPGG